MRIMKLVDFAINNFGSLDLYVNNLGISEEAN